MRPIDRCVKHDGARVRETIAACERHEPAAELDCTACAACCREAYGAVVVTRGDPIVHLHPDLLVRRGRSHDVRRDGDRCAALDGGRAPDEPYRCRVYDDRPTSCRDFTAGSAHCLTARRRVGLSV
jgi:Fe-S-cluster containining protein